MEPHKPIREIPVIDGLLAAAATSYGLTLATRNDRDIAGLGAAVLNLFRIGEAAISDNGRDCRMTHCVVAQIWRP